MKVSKKEDMMTNIIIFILIGIVAGILSGMFGIGGGIIVVPALVFLCGFTQLKAQGTSLAILLPPVGIFAFINYYKNENVDIKAGIIIVVFLILGSIVGSKISNNISTDLLKKGFGILMILISLKMIFTK